MKTPDEIKKGLTWCIKSNDCKGCPYEDDCYVNLRNTPMVKEALALIQQLEAGLAQWEDVAASPGAVEDMARENYRLTKELESVKQERDAAVRGLHGDCKTCKHYETENCAYCVHDPDAWCAHEDNWEWEGICPETTEVSPDA